jgi:hypothetical protein
VALERRVFDVALLNRPVEQVAQPLESAVNANTPAFPSGGSSIPALPDPFVVLLAVGMI